MTGTFLGYRRADGCVGVRNIVAILSAMDNTNPSAERIASMVNGAAALATSFGRGQIGADFEVTRRTLAGIAAHPNVAAVLVLSLSLASGQELADRVRATGKPVEVPGLQESGSALAMTMEGSASQPGSFSQPRSCHASRARSKTGIIYRLHGPLYVVCFADWTALQLGNL